MSTSREQILGRIRRATHSLPEPTPYPDYPKNMPVSRNGEAAASSGDRVGHFSKNWQAVSGKWAADWPALVEALKAADVSCGYCAPEFAGALRQAWPDAPIETEFSREKVDNYAFGITPAWGAIAETGTIVLTDQTTPARLAALAPWIHVAVIPAGNVFATVPEAVAQFPQDPSIVMVTGPSKTADIEGILIEGVHGPGIQFAMVDSQQSAGAE